MYKVIIFSICLSFISMVGYSSTSLSSAEPQTIPGNKSKTITKENKKKRKTIYLRLPAEQLKKDFQVF